MPRATISLEPERFELKTLEGGFVTLKPLPYDQVLERQDRSSRMWTETERRNKRARGKLVRGSDNGDDSDLSRMNFDMLQKETRKFEFTHCIVDHNLEDEVGAKLDFTERGIDLTLKIIHPKIAEEISELIDDMNDPGTAEDRENFIKEYGRSSTEKETASTPE